MNVIVDELLFLEKNRYLASHYEQVDAHEFYQDLFQEGWLERRNDLTGGKPNAIFSAAYKKPPEQIAEIEEKEKEEEALIQAALARGDKKPRFKRRKRILVKNTLVFDGMDGLDEVLNESDPLHLWTITSPVAFSGKTRTNNNGYHLWGMTIDLDGVGMDQLKDLLYQIDNEVIPRPTYLVNSGTGFHVYYMFEEPIPMYPRLMDQLKALKRELTNVVWNRYTSVIPAEERQFQGLVQGFRAVGTRTKLGSDFKVTAFRIGRKHTLQYLMDWAENDRDIDFDEFSHVTLDEAREKWPEWYQARIEEGKPRKPFDFPPEVYESWLRRMELGTFDGNRYNCVANMFSLALRCGISFEDVMADAMSLVPRLNRLTRKRGNQFTEDDVLDAASYYDEAYRNMGLKTVYHMTKIAIPPTPRNYRSQKVHLARIRTLQQLDDPDGTWRNKKGRPKGSGTAAQSVAAYRAEHPEATVTEVARALKISRPTVYKWWDAKPAPPPFIPYRFTPGGVEPVYQKSEDGKQGQLPTSESLKALRKYMDKQS